MRRRGGFALAAVLAAMVIMAMMVAVSAQRALVGAREGALSLARAELSAASAAAVADLSGAPADGARARTLPPGVVLDRGSARVGPALAEWTVTAALFPYAQAAIAAHVPVPRGSAREVRQLLVVLREDSAAGPRWVPAGASGWVRIPLP